MAQAEKSSVGRGGGAGDVLKADRWLLIVAAAPRA